MLSVRRCEFLKFWPFSDPKMTNFCFIHKIDAKTFKKNPKDMIDRKFHWLRDGLNRFSKFSGEKWENWKM